MAHLSKCRTTIRNECGKVKREAYTVGGEKPRHKSRMLCPYPWWLVSGKHAPRVPVQVSPKRCVLSLPKAIDVLGGKASGDADEHVIEGEAKELRVPAATNGCVRKGTGYPLGFKELAFQEQQNS